MTNENLPNTPATTTPRLTKAQRRTVRRRAQRAKEEEARQQAKVEARQQANNGGRPVAPATKTDSAKIPAEPRFAALSGAARRALSRSTVTSTEIKAIRATQSQVEAERERKSAARDAEMRRRKLNRRLPKR